MTNEATTVAKAPGLEVQVWSSPMHILTGPEGKTYSPISSALILGEREAVLVDAQLMTADIDVVGDLIERSGRTLKAIFVTHGHGDHYFGIDRFSARFPGVRVVGAPSTVDYIRKNRERDIPRFRAMFKHPELIEEPSSAPQALEDDTIDLEGHALKVVDVEQADMAPSTLLWVPGVDVAIVGDAVYNRTHVSLATTGPDEWKKWIGSIRDIAAMSPRAVIAGHRQPTAPDNDMEAILGGSEQYITDFIRLYESSDTADELVGSMLAIYPAWTNPSTLLGSAAAAMKKKERCQLLKLMSS